MKIIAGLGNPGPQYETTRHNAGFLAVDRLVEAWSATGPQTGQEAEIYQTIHKGQKILLVKPQTFMNLSGKCLGPLMKFYKCAPEDLIVIHDDLDLPPLTLRVKTGGGTGGHNGLKSIDQHLGAGATGYHRVRIGIGKPEFGRSQTTDHVLNPFSDAELNALDAVLDQVVRISELLIDGKAIQAMNEFNGAQKEGE